MAKTKHQKLAKLMQQILLGIEEHASKVAQQLNLIQMHFYEKKYIFERPLMPQKTLEKMMQSHFLGLQHFSPNPDLREKVLKNGMIGFILPEPAPSKSKIIHRQTVGWFIPWGVRVLSPRDNQAWLDQRKLVAILYCPRTSELSKVIDWYEIEDASDSLTYQILTMAEYERQMAIIQGILLKDPFPLWKQAKKEWQAPPSEDSDPDWVYEVAKKPRDLDGLDFAPQEGQSLASAYEAVIESIREKKHRHHNSLRKVYKTKLEETIFSSVQWSADEKQAFLLQWQHNFFEDQPKKKYLRSGRWDHCQVIDRYTAAKIIKSFMEVFISDPDNRKAGEIACVLWILIWSAQKGKSGCITIRKVLELSSQDLNSLKPIIEIGGIKLDISLALHQLLRCLCGKGEAIRSCRLFANLDKGGKALERALHDVSTELFGENVTPIQPGAFLESPHLYPGVRMTAAQRRTMKNTRRFVQPLYTHMEIKKMLRKANEDRI